jgi:hypothetical protein
VSHFIAGFAGPWILRADALRADLVANAEAESRLVSQAEEITSLLREIKTRVRISPSSDVRHLVGFADSPRGFSGPNPRGDSGQIRTYGQAARKQQEKRERSDRLHQPYTNVILSISGRYAVRAGGQPETSDWAGIRGQGTGTKATARAIQPGD